METVTTLQSGNGRGTTALVNEQGSLHTDVRNTVDVRSADMAVHRTTATVATSSGTLVAARSGRRGLLIQNQGTGDIHVRFEDAAATTADLRIGPGETFHGLDLPYAGAVRAIAASANEATLVLELA